jgi:hypothetical protein
MRNPRILCFGAVGEPFRLRIADCGKVEGLKRWQTNHQAPQIAPACPRSQSLPAVVGCTWERTCSGSCTASAIVFCATPSEAKPRGQVPFPSAWERGKRWRDGAMGDSRFTNHESRITNHESRITNHESRITNHESRITDHGSRITDHGSRITHLFFPVSGIRYPKLKPPQSESLLRQSGYGGSIRNRPICRRLNSDCASGSELAHIGPCGRSSQSLLLSGCCFLGMTNKIRCGGR